jgi:thioredoxin-like negative regulator of GroEL
MTSVLLATIVQTAMLATGVEAAPPGTDSYAEARRTTAETGKPMVVMVSTDWCVPCQMMKKDVMPQVRRRGLLRKVSFAMVNPDKDGELAQELTDGGPVPQLVMFRKKGGGGWTRSKLVGGQSVETVEEFIKEGLAKDDNAKADKKDKKPASEASGKSAPQADQRTAHRDVTDDGDESAQHG